MLPIDSRYDKANSWHTDVTFVDRVPKASLLRAITLPEYGGTTTWASTEAAYDQLPPPLRALVENLWAVHTNDYDYVENSTRTTEANRPTRQRAVPRGVRLRRTTRPSIPWCGCIPRPAGGSCCSGTSSSGSSAWAPTESTTLLQLLQARVTKLENTIRWNWQPGDLAIWDNRATQHYAVSDYDDQYRRLSRVTLAGDIPVDVHGTPSRVIAGDASHYSDVVAPARLVAVP